MLGIACLVPCTAYGYRPFDGTDAAVPDEGEFELELGPSYRLDASRFHNMTLPDTTLNFGIAEGWELAVSTTNVARLGSLRTRALDVVAGDVHLKTIVRKGCLQGESGPSVAAEFGAIVPSGEGRTESAGSFQIIVSEALRPFVFHLNAGVVRDTMSNSNAFTSLIVEGQTSGPLRPVVEIEAQPDFSIGCVYSALAGGIWNPTEGLALDAAWRGTVNETAAFGTELRVGLTWETELWRARGSRVSSKRAEP